MSTLYELRRSYQLQAWHLRTPFLNASKHESCNHSTDRLLRSKLGEMPGPRGKAFKRLVIIDVRGRQALKRKKD